MCQRCRTVLCGYKLTQFSVDELTMRRVALLVNCFMDRGNIQEIFMLDTSRRS